MPHYVHQLVLIVVGLPFGAGQHTAVISKAFHWKQLAAVYGINKDESSDSELK